MRISKHDAKLLGRITTRDEAGSHFAMIYGHKFLTKMEKAGLIQINRPVHEPTGIAYSQDYWTIEITTKGIAAGEAMNWGE